MSPDGDYRCPTCGKAVGKGAEEFPFCSERCRWVDLGKWLTEGYRIPAGAADLAGEESEGSSGAAAAPRPAPDPEDEDGGDPGPPRR